MKYKIISMIALILAFGSIYAADYTWTGAGMNLKVNTPENWSPEVAPTATDNIFFKNFTATTTTGIYGVQNFTAANNLSIENLTVPEDSRFFIYTSGTPVINGNLFVGNIDTITSGNAWRSANIRGGGQDFTIKGSITIAPTSTTTQPNASLLTIGGTNTGGFYKSLNIGENASINEKTGYKTAIYLDATYAYTQLELAGANAAGDTSNWAKVHGVVEMNNSADGKKLSIFVISRNEEAGLYKDSHVSIGGLNGSGNIQTKLLSNDSNAATSYLTFTNAAGVKTSFSGNVTRSLSSNRDNIAFIMDGAGSQTLHLASGTTGVSSVTVKNGTLLYYNKDAAGVLTVEGGTFGTVDGGATFASATIKGGSLSFANGESFLGGTPDKIAITGKFAKSISSAIEIDFGNLDATELIGYTFDLITAGSLEGFSSDANTDFKAINISKGFANFAWSGTTLQVSFASVPEPATIAAFIGILALALAAYRRRK